jgi:hypothetical protein
MICAGFGFGFFPEYAVTMPGLECRPLIEPVMVRTVCLVTMRGRPHSPGVGAFVRAARGFPWPGASPSDSVALAAAEVEAAVAPDGPESPDGDRPAAAPVAGLAFGLEGGLGRPSR